ncbi:unnamed protein product [Protopolystoma xenopodis]|uniref:Uncharacterized protein n=1 Tax=Protopolystoma xenopodis TaxID=117903 RepID=A0A448XJ05_9PLAT|nr:unnamed protein product [Protopolystoma xenopodis]
MPRNPATSALFRYRGSRKSRTTAVALIGNEVVRSERLDNVDQVALFRSPYLPTRLGGWISLKRCFYRLTTDAMACKNNTIFRSCYKFPHPFLLSS